MEKIKFVLKNDAEISEYFKEWLEDINSQISAKKPGQSVENHPEIKAALEEMQAAWTASLKESDISVKIKMRENALIKLGRTINRNLK